ncbi:hypothetical protein HDU80_008653 [Chytriomyces hyalinus]|nr:hypothetical protein HDU80_008653 [Chytriomyces hyalinus]
MCWPVHRTPPAEVVRGETSLYNVLQIDPMPPGFKLGHLSSRKDNDRTQYARRVCNFVAWMIQCINSALLVYDFLTIFDKQYDRSRCKKNSVRDDDPSFNVRITVMALLILSMIPYMLLAVFFCDWGALHRSPVFCFFVWKSPDITKYKSTVLIGFTLFVNAIVTFCIALLNTFMVVWSARECTKSIFVKNAYLYAGQGAFSCIGFILAVIAFRTWKSRRADFQLKALRTVNSEAGSSAAFMRTG